MTTFHNEINIHQYQLIYLFIYLSTFVCLSVDEKHSAGLNISQMNKTTHLVHLQLFACVVAAPDTGEQPTRDRWVLLVKNNLAWWADLKQHKARTKLNGSGCGLELPQGKSQNLAQCTDICHSTKSCCTSSWSHQSFTSYIHKQPEIIWACGQCINVSGPHSSCKSRQAVGKVGDVVGG